LRNYAECRILFILMLNVVMLSVLAPFGIDIKDILSSDSLANSA
jgi:hypothetical protein